jgi:hypothetical protein
VMQDAKPHQHSPSRTETNPPKAMIYFSLSSSLFYSILTSHSVSNRPVTMLFILWTAYNWYSSPAIAAPIQNLTALNTVIAPSWVPDPSGRGTWNLLYSCLFTLLLCVYTAIHLNVPAWYDTKIDFWLRKTKWVFITILALEIVVYVAFEQWVAARS